VAGSPSLPKAEFIAHRACIIARPQSNTFWKHCLSLLLQVWGKQQIILSPPVLITCAPKLRATSESFSMNVRKNNRSLKDAPIDAEIRVEFTMSAYNTQQYCESEKTGSASSRLNSMDMQGQPKACSI
jgi:hypothetical protein